MDSAPAHLDSLFLERILLLLARGRVTTTYKYALLLALIDLCVEGAGRGLAPSSVTTRQIAERLVVSYWPHTRLYEGETLRQSSTHHSGQGSQAKILSALQRFQASLGAQRSSARPDQARRQHPAAYEALLTEVEWVAISKPIPRLQVIGGVVEPFLYRINFTVTEDGRPIDPGVGFIVQRSHVLSGDFDNTLRLVPGVAEQLIVGAAVLRPLIHQLWADSVSRMNHKQDHKLQSWLFDQDRAQLAPLRQPLWDLQGGRCFYCGDPVSLPKSQVDHLLPWSRTSEDALENLVLADARCNGDKSDFLPTGEHLQPWTQRPLGDLELIAQRTQWPLERERVRFTARVVYTHLSPGLHLWRGRASLRRLEAEEKGELMRVLGASGA